MKVRPSVKKICEKCKVIKRKGKVMVICDNPVSYTHLDVYKRQSKGVMTDRQARKENVGGEILAFIW